MAGMLGGRLQRPKQFDVWLVLASAAGAAIGGAAVSSGFADRKASITFVTDEVKVNPAGEDKEPHWETAMAVNPENPKNLIGCSILNNGSDTRVYTSMDGGSIWKVSLKDERWDPVVAMGPKDRA